MNSKLDTPKILIVDDERMICEQIMDLLFTMGYSCGYILHPKALFPRLEHEPIDLILLDVYMPDVDGVTLLSRLKNHPVLKSIPVVVLTGEFSDELLARCFEAGAEDFINKPISPLVLKARIQSVIANKAYIREIEAQRNQMQEELEFAAETQQATLPKIPNVPFLDSSVTYLPYAHVSGDTYHYFFNESGALDIFLGDGTGHGVSAAFITMMVHMGLHSMRENLPTNEIVRRLNTHLFRCSPRNRFMTGIYMRVFPNGRLKLTGAGHPPALLIPADGGDIRELETNGQALGMFQEEITPILERNYGLEVGDKIVMYTDGILEWHSRQDEKFGLKALKQILQEYRDLEIKPLLATLYEAVERFSQGFPCQDDITMVGYTYTGDSSLIQIEE